MVPIDVQPVLGVQGGGAVVVVGPSRRRVRLSSSEYDAAQKLRELPKWGADINRYDNALNRIPPAKRGSAYHRARSMVDRLAVQYNTVAGLIRQGHAAAADAGWLDASASPLDGLAKTIAYAVLGVVCAAIAAIVALLLIPTYPIIAGVVFIIAFVGSTAALVASALAESSGSIGPAGVPTGGISLIVRETTSLVTWVIGGVALWYGFKVWRSRRG
ncbi:MAG: hypothetical protein ACKVW3_11760 [Phycisphaerales bacterium]